MHRLHVVVEWAGRTKNRNRIIVFLSGVTMAALDYFFLGVEWYFAIFIILISIFFAALVG